MRLNSSNVSSVFIRVSSGDARIGVVQIETLEQSTVLVSGHINSRVTALDWYVCLRHHKLLRAEELTM